VRVGVCENFPECTLAQRHEPQEIAPGEPFSCRGCGLELVEKPTPPERPRLWRPIVLALACVVAIVGIGAILYERSYPGPSGSDAEQSPPRLPPPIAKAPDDGKSAPAGTATPTPPPPNKPTERKALLRLAGSNTIGGELAPALVKEYLVSRGAAHVEAKSTAKDEMSVTAELDGAPVGVTIAAHGTATGFTALEKRR
jgi:hypothetical protein